MNLRLLAIIGGSFAFTAAILAVVAWVLISGDKAAHEGSTRFASALVGGGQAPKGTDGYVRGVRSQFGEITSARVIDTRNHRVGRGNNARTYHLSDVLLQTAKGPAVIELAFDGVGPVSKDITRVYEIAPHDVPDSALSDTEFVALAKAYGRRGGSPASDLASVRLTTPAAVKRLPAKVKALAKADALVSTPSPELREAKRRLRCIQRADGDVEKMTACAS